MKRIPILPGMRVSADWRVVGDAERAMIPAWLGPGQYAPDYTDPATCGAALAWCHRELSALAVAVIPTARRTLARRAINDARVWDAASVERAVTLTLEAMP